ncbi:MAG: hypothetical protein ACPGU9_05430 [Flavobacteriaceae bacterium]
MSEENKNNNTGLKVTLGILALLLIGASVMFFLKNNELNETKTALNSEISVLGDKLDDEIEKLNVQISENEVLNEDLLAKRDSLNVTLNELRASQATVETLTKYKNSYFKLKKDIKKLLADNEELQLQNTRLSQANDTLVGQLDSQLKLADSLTSQMSNANRLIKTASQLSVVGLKGLPLRQKSSGKQLPTTKAKRTDKVKICFTLAENKIAEQGLRTLYVQVLDSKNNVLGKNYQVELDGKTLNYSLGSEFNYTNKALDICDYIHAPKNGFEQGNYFVNVFSGSRLVANSTFTLE